MERGIVSPMASLGGMVERYTALAATDAQAQWARVLARHPLTQGGRQEAFLPIETLLCYGLFFVFDPHRYGGANLHRLPPVAATLATLFRRTRGSILSKMLNLDGSRTNGGRDEPALFATLSSHPALYRDLYAMILSVARDLALDDALLPDFLDYLHAPERSDHEEARATAPTALLLGQDELPVSDGAILDATDTSLLNEWIAPLGEEATERLGVGRVRLAQHRFARNVLQNWQGACAFCGFQPRTLPRSHGLLRASHVKPWAQSEAREKVDVRNGLAACPIHDAAFDQGHITVSPDRRIVRSSALERSIANVDPQVDLYFGRVLRTEITPEAATVLPHHAYLTYHHDHVYKG